ncbi:MAG TPA: VWA domain-containing protein [Bryobacteraceae bacterium]|nr:VWA domain-containing protein [Bryobacteraceae bacterium]
MSSVSRRRFLITSAGILSGAAGSGAQEEATFSSGVQVVNLFATVRDRRNEILRGLGKDDFLVAEDGRPQTIRYFSRESDLPLTIGLMIDTSLSQTRVLPAERGASLSFLDEVLRENEDHVFIMQFDLTVQTRQPLTASRRDLGQALAFVDTPTRNQLRNQYGGGTLLYDAILRASEDVMKKQQGRKALIVMSDGGENGSDATLSEAIEAAQRAETLIYTILFSDGSYGRNRGVMQSLAKETGGAYFEVSKKQTIDRVFAIIQEDLRNQYSIGYVSDRPATVAGFRRIQLSVKGPGLVVQSRNRYWAEPAPDRSAQ